LLRRTLFPVIAALVATPAPLASQPAPPEWRQFRWSADNAGVVPGDLNVRWRYKAGGGPIRGMSVAGSTLVVGTEGTGTVAALDLSTGVQRWIVELPAWVHGDPAIVGDATYVTFGSYPHDVTPGGTWKLDLQTGRVRWKFASRVGMMPSPAIRGDTVLVGGADSCIYALAAADGRILRSWCTGGMIEMSSPRLVLDSMLIAGNASGYVVGFNARSLRPAWRVRSPPIGHFGDPPFAFNGRLAFITGYERQGDNMRQLLVALDPASGQLRWTRDLGTGAAVSRNTSGTPTIAGDLVIVSSPVSRTVRAFRVDSGALAWSHQLDAGHKGAVTVIGEDVIFGDDSGRLTLLDRATGKVLGRCHFPSRFTVTQPILVGATLLAPVADGALYAEPYTELRARALRAAPPDPACVDGVRRP
jgi:outer membrane protein assembly factor BamB